MSTLSDNTERWPLKTNSLDSKYEKCRNITEEIYKRIDITFQIKKLETSAQTDLSDHSDQIDSNELSNETDLFACDKDSISSSTEAERPVHGCEKYININNNEEMKKKAVVYKRPKKRFRKRVKKNQAKPRSDTECSSDDTLPLSRVDIDSKSATLPLSLLLEANRATLPLSRLLEANRATLPLSRVKEAGNATLPVSYMVKVGNTDHGRCESPDHVMGVPKIVIVTRGLQPKIQKEKRSQIKTAEIPPKDEKSPEKGEQKGKSCDVCNLSFKGERGLRRHIVMSHPLEEKKSSTSTN